ncbi:HTH-type transcriptional activator RhaR [Paenibacillus konkukensis]|uniref:HTH-type transcriptional activator RhaR n=1 Tax=Paenibacillus konkukensis TaxID=2020716 RepID=A0ABY4RGG5_9BACL|nr:AraC family transcriptional regulator [Paenibacillus konkukensis]UQZ81332.1 HTH-type transcriptional activator RhaR [Paenibacillus konkukensis]
MKTIKFRNWQDNLYMFSYRRTYTAPVEYFHAHEGLELLYIHEGTGKYIIEDQVYSLQPRTLIVIKPFQVHYIRMDVPPVYIRSLLKIKPSVIEPFLSSLPQLSDFLVQLMEQKMPIQVFCLSEKHAAFLEQQWLQLHELFTAGPPALRKEGVRLFFFHFLLYFQSQIYVLDGHQPPGHAVSSRTSKHMNSILKWIDHHYKRPFTVHEMSDELHFSPNYLSKLFKDQTGKTITEYTNERRLEEARMLLQLQPLSVEEISKETGFKYPSYFIQMFKKRYGLTPHKYREQIAEQARTTAPQNENAFIL